MSGYCQSRLRYTLALAFFTLGFLMFACNANQPRTPTSTQAIFTNTLASTAAATATPSAAPTYTPRPTGTPTLTQTPTSAPTRRPTKTLTPTQTPFPTLPPLGPYLLYQDPNTDSLVILGSHGQGSRVIRFPKAGLIQDIQKAVSSDGKWLAFYNQSNECWGNDIIHGNRSQCLMNLADGSIHAVANFYSYEAPSDAHYGYALDWSPDGKVLAFTWAMDERYPDIYIYHLDTKKLEQWTHITRDIRSMDWSPDGKWIWFHCVLSVKGGYETSEIYLVNYDDSQPKEILVESGKWSEGLGWVTPDRYLLSTGSDGCCGSYDFRYYSAKSNTLVSLWKPSAASFAIDSDHGLLAVSNAPEMELQGSFLVDLNGNSTKFYDGILWNLIYRGGKTSQFLGFPGQQVVAIGEDGSINQVTDKDFEQASVSPDRRWFVLYHAYERVVGMDLFSENDQFKRTVSEKDVSSVLWRPDSNGLFFHVYEDGWYYVDIPDGQPVAVDTCVAEKCEFLPSADDSVWLP